MRGRDRALDAYMADLRRLPRPTRATMDALAARLLGGDESARAALAEGCLPMVVREAGRWARAHPGGAGVADLIQQGNLGLVLAARRFDPAIGARFTTYAGHYIRDRFQRITPGSGRCRPYLDRERAAGPADDGATTATDRAADPRPGPAERAERAERGRDADRLLALVTPREAELLRLRYGLDGGGERTFPEVAALAGISRSGAHLRCGKAIERLRGRMRRIGVAS